MKNYIILFIIMIIGLGIALTYYRVSEPVGGKVILLETQIINDTSDLKTLIETDLQSNGKYKRISPYDIKGITYQVDEYDASGNLGYTITITKVEDGIIYQKRIATGVEKAHRERDWTQIGNNNLTATSTP